MEQLGGQLRADSEIGQGTRFSFLLPLGLPFAGNNKALSISSAGSSIKQGNGNCLDHGMRGDEFDHLVEALSSTHLNRTIEPASCRSGAESEVEKSGQWSEKAVHALEKTKEGSSGDSESADHSPVKLRILIVEVKTSCGSYHPHQTHWFSRITTSIGLSSASG